MKVNNSNTVYGSRSRLYWIPKILLVTAAATPTFYALYFSINRGWHWSNIIGQVFVSLLIMVVPLISLGHPFIGGIIAIVITPIILIGYSFAAGMSGLRYEAEIFLIILSCLLLIGGALSIFHGILGWFKRKGKQSDV